MIAFVVALAFLADPDPDPEPGAKFEAKLARAEKFVAKVEKGATLWLITGGGGIGEASVKVSSGEVPKKVVVRFPGLTNLEMFKIKAGDATGNVRLGGTSYWGAGGMATKDAATLTLTARAGKDCVEVVVETKTAAKEWTFAWVNEYRK